VKTKLGLILGITLLATAAHAGLFDFMRGIPDGPPPLFSAEERVKMARMLTPDVPTGPNCNPTFLPGDDGLFRRTVYCHRANPTQPKWFLDLGYDVPAEFLKGFTETDVLTRWKAIPVVAKEFLGTKVEVPTELFTSLNVTAAQTWEKMLQCAGGDAELAREMYRTAAFDCADGELIRARIADLRSSLPALAATLQLAVFADGSRVEEMIRENRQKRDRLYIDRVYHDFQRYTVELSKLDKEEFALSDLRNKMETNGLIEVLEKYIPHVPRMHPLLVQVMFEELLSFTSPDESARSAANRLKNDNQQRIYMTQILLWIHSIEDRGCATMGLWPTANRVAAETLGDKTVEIKSYISGSKQKMVRNFNIVACPIDRMDYRSRNGYATAYDVMRLADVYTQGRENVWRELREVRERYVLAVKK
jgi:hypothetical protein